MSIKGEPPKWRPTDSCKSNEYEDQGSIPNFKRVRPFSTIFSKFINGKFRAECSKESNCCNRNSDNPRMLTLTSSLAIPAFTTPNISISEDGYMIYIVAGKTGFDDRDLPIAEFYENNNGRLDKYNVLPPGGGYYGQIGYASNCFTVFNMAEFIPVDGNIIQMRISLYDRSFSVINQTIVEFEVSSFDLAFVLGGQFTHNGKYFSYIITDGNKSTVLIYRTEDLLLMEQFSVEGCNVEESKWLVIKNSSGKNIYYFTTLTGAGYYSGDNNRDQTLNGPYKLSIWKFSPNDKDPESGDITHSVDYELPYIATLDVINLGKESLIAVAGFLSLFETETSVQFNNSLYPTNLQHDSAEVRILLFNNYKLKLQGKQHADANTSLTFFPPARGTALLYGINNPLTQGDITRESFSLVEFAEKYNGEVLKALSLPKQDTVNVVSKFSKDGRWLVRIGTYGYADGRTCSDSSGIMNFLLYKVNY